MINKETGDLNTNYYLPLNRATTIEYFKDFPNTKLDQYLKLDEVVFNNIKVQLNTEFKHDRLWKIHIHIPENEFKNLYAVKIRNFGFIYPLNYNCLKNEFAENLLTELLGSKKRSFPWGKIHIYYLSGQPAHAFGPPHHRIHIEIKFYKNKAPLIVT